MEGMYLLLKKVRAMSLSPSVARVLYRVMPPRTRVSVGLWSTVAFTTATSLRTVSRMGVWRLQSS